MDLVLKEITHLEMRHGLKRQSIKNEAVQQHARYSERPMKMVVRGGFEGFYCYLLDIERLSRLTQLKQMKLSKLKGGEEGELEAEFTLSIFFEPQAAKTRMADGR